MKRWAGRLAFGIGLALAQRASGENAFEAVLVGEGNFTAWVVVAGTKVTLTLMPKGNSGWMSAHLHRGAAGADGRLVAEFPWTSGDGSARTSFASISERDAAGLAAEPGKYYVDVHTADFPAGAARGQLAASTNPDVATGRIPLPVAPVAYPVGSAPAVPAMGSSPPLPPPAGMPPPAAGVAAPRGPGFGEMVRPPFTSPYEFFFRLLGDAQPASREHYARAAGLTDKEAAILTDVAAEFNRARVLADEKLRARAASPGSPSPETARLFEERKGLADKSVAQLRTRLGDVAIGDLDAYVGEHFRFGPDAPPAPQAPRTPRKEQTIDFTEPSPRVFRDPDFRLYASATSGLRVSFSATGDCTMYGSTVHILSAGKCWVTAHQPGDSRFEAAPDVEQRIVIAKAGQRIDGDAPAAKTFLDPDFPLDMSATSGLSVVFFASGDCTVGGSTVHITGAGTCSLTAHQPGDTNYLAARIVDARFTIAKADQKIEFEEFLNPYFGPYVIPLNARASSGLPVVYGIAYGPCTIIGDSLRIPDSGECLVTGSQPGDRNFNPAAPVRRALQVVIPPPPPPPPAAAPAQPSRGA